MSLSDTAKALQRHAQSLLSGNRIVFHHVPKCGGTSVGRALRLSYFLSQGTVTPIESDKAFRWFKIEITKTRRAGVGPS